MPDLGRLKDRSPRWAKTLADRSTRSVALATSGLRPPPDFLVIGTKRGGTTSMFNYLLMHPGVLGLFPQSRGKKSTDYFFKERARGDRWYRSHFHTRPYRALLRRRHGHVPVGGEASPYYMYDPRVAPLAAALHPGLRAIALLRNPVERAWSHYQERVHMGVEPLSFTEALDREHERTAGEVERMHADPSYYSSAHDWYSYRDRGIYLPQLQAWEAAFPAGRLLVLTSEEMYRDVQGVVARVWSFLDVPPFRLPTTKSFNTITRSPIPDDTRAELAEFYAPHNLALEAHLGRSVGWGD
ncbi:MAG: sulfotransferase domain-containing protein [Nocardioidaceae bacterium]